MFRFENEIELNHDAMLHLIAHIPLKEKLVLSGLNKSFYSFFDSYKTTIWLKNLSDHFYTEMPDQITMNEKEYYQQLFKERKLLHDYTVISFLAQQCGVSAIQAQYFLNKVKSLNLENNWKTILIEMSTFDSNLDIKDWEKVQEAYKSLSTLINLKFNQIFSMKNGFSQFGILLATLFKLSDEESIIKLSKILNKVSKIYTSGKSDRIKEEALREFEEFPVGKFYIESVKRYENINHHFINLLEGINGAELIEQYMFNARVSLHFDLVIVNNLIRINAVELTKLLLNKHPGLLEFDLTELYGYSLLHLAAEAAHPELVELFIKMGANVNCNKGIGIRFDNLQFNMDTTIVSPLYNALLYLMPKELRLDDNSATEFTMKKIECVDKIVTLLLMNHSDPYQKCRPFTLDCMLNEAELIMTPFNTCYQLKNKYLNEYASNSNTQKILNIIEKVINYKKTPEIMMEPTLNSEFKKLKR